VAQFDVYRVAGGYAIDCQSDLLSHLDTRLVVPLNHPDNAPKPADRLNPFFTVEGQSLVMVTQFAGVVSVKSLRDKVLSLTEHEYTIKSALDMLTSGY
jgi:toxin CcdB